MTANEANEVYDVLARECGAPDGRDGLAARATFVDACTSDRPPREWCFCGALGLGGKFYTGRHGEPHRVGYYREDDTPERRAMVERANKAFREMVKR